MQNPQLGNWIQIGANVAILALPLTVGMLLLAGCGNASSSLPGNGDDSHNAEGRPATISAMFQCSGVGALTIRHIGPDSIELDSGSLSAVLRRVRVASGTRYLNDELEFWNRGEEALYIVNGEKHECVVEPEQTCSATSSASTTVGGDMAISVMSAR